MFFDLVFAMLSSPASCGHNSLSAARETLLLLLVICPAWVTTTWSRAGSTPNRNEVRLVLVEVMAASMVLGAAMAEACEGDGLLFAAAFSSLQAGRCLSGAVTPSMSRAGATLTR